ncbi:MAG: tRNA-binding protein [Sinomicrobium sp.]|nr:tRNA-binding protein [Sinomicrobium sp.]
MEANVTSDLGWDDFMKVEMRTGTVIGAEVFAEARHPAYKITIDFGPFGIRKTSAQVTRRYSPEALIGKQVVAVINFPPKQIATMMSECLLLGAVDENNDVVLLQPGINVKNGLRIG